QSRRLHRERAEQEYEAVPRYGLSRTGVVHYPAKRSDHRLGRTAPWRLSQHRELEKMKNAFSPQWRQSSRRFLQSATPRVGVLWDQPSSASRGLRSARGELVP